MNALDRNCVHVKISPLALLIDVIRSIGARTDVRSLMKVTHQSRKVVLAAIEELDTATELAVADLRAHLSHGESAGQRHNMFKGDLSYNKKDNSHARNEYLNITYDSLAHCEQRANSSNVPAISREVLVSRYASLVEGCDAKYAGEQVDTALEIFDLDTVARALALLRAQQLDGKVFHSLTRMLHTVCADIRKEDGKRARDKFGPGERWATDLGDGVLLRRW